MDALVSSPQPSTGEFRAGFKVRSLPVRPATLVVRSLGADHSGNPERYQVTVPESLSCSHRDLIDWAHGDTVHYGGRVLGPVVRDAGLLTYEVEVYL